MNGTKLLTALVAVLVVSAGAGAAAAATSIDEEQTSVDATFDDGTVTVEVTQNESGVENVSVEANGEEVGMTDANGNLTFETNATEELELELEKGDMEIEREYAIENGTLVDTDDEEEDAEDEEEDDEGEEESTLDATATYDNGTVEVLVTKNGSAVENVSVEANGEEVGTTGTNGSLAFETNATEELELEFEKGEMELEQKYSIHNGTLVLDEEETENADEGNVTLSADEHASDRAHSVLATVQEWLNSDTEQSLGQMIQETLGDDRGNSENAGNSEAADDKVNSEAAEEKGNSDAAEDKGASDEKGISDAADDKSENENDDDEEDDDEDEEDEHGET